MTNRSIETLTVQSTLNKLSHSRVEWFHIKIHVDLIDNVVDSSHQLSRGSDNSSALVAFFENPKDVLNGIEVG